VSLNAADVLPPMRLGAVEGSTGDGHVAVIEAGSGADAAHVVVEFGSDDGAGFSIYGTWSFLIPPDLETLRLPDPAIVTEHYGASGGTIEINAFGSAMITAMEAENAADYDEFKRLPVGFISYIEGHTMSFEPPEGVLLRSTNWRPNQP
jgi:hypothetical protein